MRRQDKYPNTDIFHFANLNPFGRITTDCVVRAIAKALLATISNDPTLEKEMWEVVLTDLTDYACETGYMLTDTKCYTGFLETRGFIKQPQPRHLDGTKYTLREFIKEHPRGIYLVNMPSHLTVVINGVNYDVWDCTKSSQRVGIYWRKENQ